MKIYLAAMFSKLETMANYAKLLQEDGHEIVSSWVFGGEDGLTMTQIAELDVADVAKCEVLIKFTNDFGTPVTGGGRHTEFGIAMATGKRVLICGPREQVFDWHPDVVHWPSFELVRRYLKIKEKPDA